MYIDTAEEYWCVFETSRLHQNLFHGIIFIGDMTVRDVSVFGGSTRSRCAGCLGITDVSALRGVKNLDVRFCEI